MQNILLFFFISFSCFSQKTISLKDEKIRLNAPLFHIKDVQDGRLKKGSIGTFFTKNEEKTSISISNGVKNSIKSFLRKNLSSDTTTSKILYNIKKLSLSEKKKSDKEITGKIEILVSFEKINEEDSTFLIEENFEKSYTRTFNDDDTENYEIILRQLIVLSIKYFDGWLNLNHSRHEAFVKNSRIVFLPDIQTEDADTLCFGKREISWEDFKGKPMAYSRFGGAIFSTISYSAEYGIEKNQLICRLETKVYMVKGMSWIRNEGKTENALEHEKTHFRIAKIIMDRFKEKVAAFNAPSVADLQSMIQLQYLDSYREMNKLQEQYDDETNHGGNTTKQYEWQEKVKKMLENNP